MNDATTCVFCPKNANSVKCSIVFPFSAVEDNNKESSEGKSSTKNQTNPMHTDKNKTGSINVTVDLVDKNNKDSSIPNFCDRLLEANDDIKVEIKSDPDAPSLTFSSSNVQPALGSDLLPLHAANSKHPVSFFFHFQ